MSGPQPDKVFAGSIPRLYEQYLVPLIFEPYAIDLANRVASRPCARVLEIAAGTGVVTRKLAVGAAEDGCHRRDRSEPADARPGRHARNSRAPSIGARPMRCDCLSRTLPSTPWSASSASCSFPTSRRHFRKRAACCAREALSCSTSGTASRKTNSPTASRPRSNQLFPDDPPRFMARTPHGYHDPAAIAGDLQAAGFVTSPRVEHDRGAQ